MKFSWLVPALFNAIVMVVGGVGLAQETDTKWLIGVWESEGENRFGDRTRSTVEFKEEGGEIRWELVIASSPFPRLLGSKARGVAKVSGVTVTMEGEYYEGAAMGPLSTNLLRKGDVLEGTARSSNVPIRIAMRKIK